MGNTAEILNLALKVLPEEVCLVPENRKEITTEGGLDAAGQIKQLEPLMKDETVIGRTTINGQAATAELRDIALGVAILATGQKPADYGFDRLRDNTPAISYYYYTLTGPGRLRVDWSIARDGGPMTLGDTIDCVRQPG